MNLQCSYRTITSRYQKTKEKDYKHDFLNLNILMTSFFLTVKNWQVTSIFPHTVSDTVADNSSMLTEWHLDFPPKMQKNNH